MPALVGREGVVGGGEEGEHPPVGEPRVGVSVEEDDRFTRWITSLGVVQPRARREADCSELRVGRLAHRLPPSRSRGGMVHMRQHNGSRRSSLHQQKGYSPYCLEGFSPKFGAGEGPGAGPIRCSYSCSRQTSGGPTN